MKRDKQIPTQSSSTQPLPSARTPLSIQIALLIYQLAWSLAIPFLRRNHRLQLGFSQRVLQEIPATADLWIQASSVGEAFLTWEIIKKLKPAKPIRVLLTTYTSQGMEILEKARTEVMQQSSRLTIHTAYFPFDHPKLMTKAVAAVQPKVILLLESELWPGLLHACKQQQVKVLVANGRMTAKSLSRYLFWPSLWHQLRPDQILAISTDNASHFATLFGRDRVETMPNIKFDRISNQGGPTAPDNPLTRLFPAEAASLIVLGSARQEEEADITKLVCALRERNKEVIIALFPRHMHRIDNWKKILEDLKCPWQLRSRITEPVDRGTIILWDAMGEMLFAYQLASAAFVGGSLAPLGGQNFLEPLTCGIKPVIGPHWTNFSWIGKEIITQKLVFQAQNWQEAAEILTRKSSQRPQREETRQETIAYVESRRGGTEQTCTTINKLLLESSNQ